MAQSPVLTSRPAAESVCAICLSSSRLTGRASAAQSAAPPRWSGWAPQLARSAAAAQQLICRVVNLNSSSQLSGNVNEKCLTRRFDVVMTTRSELEMEVEIGL
jgi:hypothetical protein